METFKELYEQGKANQDLLDELVDTWHDSVTDDCSLEEFLGFRNLQEYHQAIRKISNTNY